MNKDNKSVAEIAGAWVQIDCDRALYLDAGKNAVLCDRLPSPVTLLLKNPVHQGVEFLPALATDALPTSLADRGGTSAAHLSSESAK